jgi:hypothetical protein
MLVIAELINLSNEPLTVVVPFRDTYREEAEQIELHGQQGRCPYVGPNVNSLLDPNAFSTIPPNGGISGQLEILPANFESSGKVGFYQLWYTYVIDERHQRAAAAYKLPTLWTGEIRCGPVELQRLVAAPEGGPPDCEIERNVTIAVPAGGYRFTLAEAAAGVKLNYTITVTNDLSGVIPQWETFAYDNDPGCTDLCVNEEISAKGQSYAIRDVGHLAPPSNQPITLKKGHFSCAVQWRGKNWNGPSDTSQPEGPPFPAGEYWLKVSMIGRVLTPRGERPYRLASIAPVILAP